MTTPDPVLKACQQVAKHANAAGLSPQEFARAMNNLDAIAAEESRNYRLEELYHQDGRHEPSHPMHGLYTGLVQTTSTTTPQEHAMNDEFMFFTLPDGQKIAIRKSSVTAVFPDKYGQTSTIIECLGSLDGVVVNEGFDKVCAALGIAAPQEEAQP